MANLWDESDYGTLEMLVRMIDAYWENPANASMVGKIRQIKSDLGLTPEGRKKLRWLLPGETPGDLTAVPSAGVADLTAERHRRRADPRKQ